MGFRLVGSKEVTRWDGALVLLTQRLRLRAFVIEDLPAYAERTLSSTCHHAALRYLSGRPANFHPSSIRLKVAGLLREGCCCFINSIETLG